VNGHSYKYLLFFFFLLFFYNNKTCSTCSNLFQGGHWLDRVLEEIKMIETKYGTGPGAFGRAEPNAAKEVFNMDVLYACVKEAVRMYPPLMFLMRQVCNKPLNVCGYDIPIGSRVWVSTAVAQRLPEVFSNPDTYDPGRWLQEGDNGFDIRKFF